MNLITSIWAKRGDEAEGADHAAGNTGAVAREDLASALAAHHEADLGELREEEQSEAVEAMVNSYIGARNVRVETAAAIAEGTPADLAAEIGFARVYAGEVGADRAELLVREYAGHYGTPERETTVRIARDAAENCATVDVTSFQDMVRERLNAQSRMGAGAEFGPGVIINAVAEFIKIGDGEAIRITDARGDSIVMKPGESVRVEVM